MQAGNAVHVAIATLQVAEQELLLFTAFWLIAGAVDDLAVDLCWIGLKAAGRLREPGLPAEQAALALTGPCAILIAAWREHKVIGHTIRHALSAWKQQELVLYVGCYCNDRRTIAAAVAAAGQDGRVRIVIHAAAGPTSKADCLNRLYEALCEDEIRNRFRFRSVVLHDAEDRVHPAALALIDGALDHADFVQLPVWPERDPKSRWIGGHYADEFTESHAKLMVVRDALHAALPAAGVGCGFSRELIGNLAWQRIADGGTGPFAADCLTEDYELGVLVWRQGRVSRFLRVRDETGALVATRAYFPGRLQDAVRQKARWIHGIAFQGWDRLGWRGGLADMWMALRDRRGPLTAVVLAGGYVLIVVEALLAIARMSGWSSPTVLSPTLRTMLVLCLASLLWRAAMRFAFTARAYGLAEGGRAVLRIPVANLVTILAASVALTEYLRSLTGRRVRWNKTEHHLHPASHEAEAGR